MSNHSGLDILFVYAHPDDETFGNGGTLAWTQANELNVGLVCATRGEVGEISDVSLGPASMLGAIRERELRTAMNTLGVNTVRLLGYRDSGMIGTPENNDPRSLVQASEDELLSDVVLHIRDLKPRIVVTFGPEGGYGHPDHIRIGNATTRGVEMAASDALPWLGPPWQVDSLYWASIDRDLVRQIAAHGHSFFSRLTPEELETIGTPRAEITHFFDLEPYIDRKLEAMRAHATQLPFDPGDESPLNPATRPNLGRESFRKIPLSWSAEQTEPDLFDKLHEASLATLAG